ncbi:hypothetical protein BHM03_00012810 [Ensete ventricosum]|nr:hypothetical protein BHM03_00012810 [Ensete ventricosum]
MTNPTPSGVYRGPHPPLPAASSDFDYQWAFTIAIVDITSGSIVERTQFAPYFLAILPVIAVLHDAIDDHRYSFLPLSPCFLDMTAPSSFFDGSWRCVPDCPFFPHHHRLLPRRLIVKRRSFYGDIKRHHPPVPRLI